MRILLSLLLLLLPLILQAQKVKVVSKDGDLIPNLYLLSSDRATFISSNEEGVLDLSDIGVSDTAKFTIMSGFYKPLTFSLGYLKSKSEIIVEYESQKLMGAFVMPQKQIIQLLENAATYFSQHYIKDYVAVMHYKREIYSREFLRQLYLVDGLWGSFNFHQSPPRLLWNDKNLMGRFLTLDAFVSDFFLPDSNKPMEIFAVHSSGISDNQIFDVDYVNIFDLKALDMKRAIELYSPLNKRHIKDFKYHILSFSESEQGKIYTIAFKTKEGTFPKRNKLLGSGCLTITEEGGPIKVEVENMEDRYSTRMHDNWPEANTLVTPYKLEISYGRNELGIYTSSVVLNLSWIYPQNIRQSWKNSYMVEWNVYRKPFKNQYNTKTIIEFSNHILISSGAVRNLFLDMNISGHGASLSYVDGINQSFWNERIKKLPNRQKIEKDLYSDHTPLHEQAERNNLRLMVDKNSAERNKIARSLYKELYGTEYYD